MLLLRTQGSRCDQSQVEEMNVRNLKYLLAPFGVATGIAVFVSASSYIAAWLGVPRLSDTVSFVPPVVLTLIGIGLVVVWLQRGLQPVEGKHGRGHHGPDHPRPPAHPRPPRTCGDLLPSRERFAKPQRGRHSEDQDDRRPDRARLLAGPALHQPPTSPQVPLSSAQKDIPHLGLRPGRVRQPPTQDGFQLLDCDIEPCRHRTAR